MEVYCQRMAGFLVKGHARPTCHGLGQGNRPARGCSGQAGLHGNSHPGMLLIGQQMHACSVLSSLLLQGCRLLCMWVLLQAGLVPRTCLERLLDLLSLLRAHLGLQAQLLLYGWQKQRLVLP